MHVVCLVSLKGGAGKSTVVQSLAVCACQHDQKTLIVELDPQGSLKNWSKRREAAEPQVYQTLPQSLGDVLDDARARGVRWVFVDTPGHESAAARAAMAAADLILIPCKIQSMKDFDAAMLTIADAQAAEKPAYVVMNQVPPNAAKLVRYRQLQMQERYNIAVLSRYLSRRADFEYCDEKGLSAAEFNPNGAAAEEVARLYDLLLSIFIVERNRREEQALVAAGAAQEAQLPQVDAQLPQADAQLPQAIEASSVRFEEQRLLVEEQSLEELAALEEAATDEAAAADNEAAAAEDDAADQIAPFDELDDVIAVSEAGEVIEPEPAAGAGEPETEGKPDRERIPTFGGLKKLG